MIIERNSPTKPWIFYPHDIFGNKLYLDKSDHETVPACHLLKAWLQNGHARLLDPLVYQAVRKGQFGPYQVENAQEAFTALNSLLTNYQPGRLLITRSDLRGLVPYSVRRQLLNPKYNQSETADFSITELGRIGHKAMQNLFSNSDFGQAQSVKDRSQLSFLDLELPPNALQEWLMSDYRTPVYTDDRLADIQDCWQKLLSLSNEADQKYGERAWMVFGNEKESRNLRFTLASLMEPYFRAFMEKRNYCDYFQNYLLTQTLMSWATVLQKFNPKGMRLGATEIPPIDSRYGLSGGRIDGVSILIDGQVPDDSQTVVVNQLSKQRYPSASALISRLERAFPEKLIQAILIEFKFGWGDGSHLGQKRIKAKDVLERARVEDEKQMRGYLSLVTVDAYLTSHNSTRSSLWSAAPWLIKGVIVYILPEKTVMHNIEVDPKSMDEYFRQDIVAKLKPEQTVYRGASRFIIEQIRHPEKSHTAIQIPLPEPALPRIYELAQQLYEIPQGFAK